MEPFGAPTNFRREIMTTYGSAIDGVATNVTTETKTLQVGRTRVYGVHVS